MQPTSCEEPCLAEKRLFDLAYPCLWLVCTLLSAALCGMQESQLWAYDFGRRRMENTGDYRSM